MISNVDKKCIKKGYETMSELVKMISPDCENCEHLDLTNPDFPCDIEETGSVLRCSILNEFVKTEGFKRELYDY